MEILLIILAFVCAAVGIIGSVVPGLPGPPLAWIGLLLLSFTEMAEISATMLIVSAVVAAVITVIDYVVPSAFTKRFGGSRAGIWGCNIGLVISIFGLPFGPQGLAGVILWPFVGALVGELLSQKPFEPALRAAFGAFIGFLTGTLSKLAYSIALIIIMIVRLINN